MTSLAPSGDQTRSGGSSVTSGRRVSLENALAALLMLIAAALYLWPVAGFSDDTDEGVYWQSLRAMSAGHPLFSSVFSSQAPLFLPSIYPFYMLFGQTIAAARIAVAIYALAGVVAMYWLASQVGGRWAGLIASALLVVDFHYSLQARTLQADVPAVAVEILAVALGVAASRRFGRQRLALAALAGGMTAAATLFKLVEIVALVPIALYLGAPLLRAFDGSEGRIHRPTPIGLRIGIRAAIRDLGMVAAGGIVVTLLTLAPFIGSFGALWNQAVAFHLAAAHTQPLSLVSNARVIWHEFKWAVLPAALAVCVAIWRRDWRMGPPVLWLLASIAILMRQVPLFDHIAIIVVPCLALMAALTPSMLAPVLSRPSGRWLILAATALTVVVFVVGLFNAAADSRRAGALTATDSVKAQLAAIDAYTTPGEVFVTDDQYAAAAAGRNVPPELVDTSFVRAASGFLTASQLEDIITRDHIRVVVFATGRLDTVPGFSIWVDAHFKKVVDLGDGQGLYVRIAPGQPAT